MRLSTSAHRILLGAMLGSLTFASATTSAPAPAAAPRASRLVVLSTTDMKGKTSPCGCHIPKGGLSRQASFADSVKAEYPAVLWVDSGGFFPEDDLHEDVAWFMMDALKLIGLDAVGIGDRDLRFGYARLRDHAKQDQLQLVSANLVLKKTQQPAFSPYVIKSIGNVNVGVFGLISDQANLGPARDTLAAQDPTVTAKRMVAELKRKGVTVIVLLSQLGKVETEDLVSTVEGMDVAITGRGVPLVQKGRLIGRTVTVYGGEQGQYMGRTILSLDDDGHVKSSDHDMFMLNPEVGEKKEVAALVQAFEDKFNEKLRKAEKEQVVQRRSESAQNNPDHYVGDAVCGRCHKQEVTQWQGTAHAHAWQTLVDKKKDATPDCIPCHVLGYEKTGGFVNATQTPKLVNVQCENCHGMGTSHDGMAMEKPMAKVAETTCRGCHNETTSPEFDFGKFKQYIDHTHNFADLPPLKGGPMKSTN